MAKHFVKTLLTDVTHCETVTLRAMLTAFWVRSRKSQAKESAMNQPGKSPGTMAINQGVHMLTTSEYAFVILISLIAAPMVAVLWGFVYNPLIG